MAVEKFRVFSASFDEIREAVRRALDDVKAKSIEWSREDCVDTAFSPFRFSSLITGGEKLTIVLDRTSGQVWVQSASRLLRMFDLEITNRGNCRRILNAIARHLDAIKHQSK